MKIMICYDGKAPSKSAVAKGGELARMLNGEILVVSSMFTNDRFHKKKIEQMEKELVEIREHFEKMKLSCTTILSTEGMEPEIDLLSRAETFDAELIIIGIRKRSQVGKLLMGSVAQYVILNSPCPVLAVK